MPATVSTKTSTNLTFKNLGTEELRVVVTRSQVRKKKIQVHGPKHPDVANVMYKIATDHCLAGDLSTALASLGTVLAGLWSVGGIGEYMQSDSDLDAIQDDEQFKNLVSAVLCDHQIKFQIRLPKRSSLRFWGPDTAHTPTL